MPLIPDIKIRGIRTPIPSGYVLGRTAGGTGDVHLIPIDQVGGIASAGSFGSTSSVGATAVSASITATAANNAAQQALSMAGYAASSDDSGGVSSGDGYMGPPGSPGSPGPAGATGMPGAATPGFPGEDGLDGNDSYIPGPQGNTGATGAAGSAASATPVIAPPVMFQLISTVTQSADYWNGCPVMIRNGQAFNAVCFISNETKGTPVITPAIYDGAVGTSGQALLASGPSVTGVTAGVNVIPLTSTYTASADALLYVGCLVKTDTFVTADGMYQTVLFFVNSGSTPQNPAPTISRATGSGNLICWLTNNP